MTSLNLPSAHLDCASSGITQCVSSFLAHLALSLVSTPAQSQAATASCLGAEAGGDASDGPYCDRLLESGRRATQSHYC